MTAPTYPLEILARAEKLLAPVATEMAAMTEAERTKARVSICEHLADDDTMEASQIPVRIRAHAKAIREQAAQQAAAAEAARVEAMRQAMLSDQFMVRFLRALAVELAHPDTRPETVRDAADELPRLFRKLRP